MVTPIELTRLETGWGEELAPFFEAYNHEVGFYVGKATTPDGRASLHCLQESDSNETFELHRILAGDQSVGFLCVSSYEVSGMYALRAIFILPDYRRQRIGTGAIAKIVEQTPGSWLLGYPLRLQSAVQFVDFVLMRIGVHKISSRETKVGELGTFRRIECSTAPQLGQSLDGRNPLLAEAALPSAVTHHHSNRRMVLVGGVLMSIASPFFASVSEGLGAMMFFCSLVLWLVYLEMVVTGILDRLDRGPLLAIKTREK